MGIHELPPLPHNHTNNYQELHYDLEKWTIFRSLPQIMQYDATMLTLMQGLANGTFKVPNF